MSDRSDWEARRLRQVARDAGLDAELLWSMARERADAATRRGEPLDRCSPLVRMRLLLDAEGIDHRARDLFGTEA